MERSSSAAAFENDDLHLRLGLPGRDESEQPSSSCIKSNKRSSLHMESEEVQQSAAPPSKAQVIGWPPVRSYRRSTVQAELRTYVKVSMDGAPYLRKIDLRLYNNYLDLVKALESMFKCCNGSKYRPTYEDKDGDWMLAGDVPWEMFITSCKRLRIMKGDHASGHFSRVSSSSSDLL